MINDIRLIKSYIKDSFSLCSFMANNGPRAAEKEVMIAQTIHACVHNFDQTGKAFSFRGQNVYASHNGGIVDNRTAYEYLVAEGYFSELKDGELGWIICPTDKLVNELKGFFKLAN